MSRRQSLLLFLLASAAPAFAQDAAPRVSADGEQSASSQPDDEYADEEGQEIVVQGQKPRGSVIGDIPPEKTLTSRDEINAQLRGVLDEATGKWGIRVNRVELKAIDPPASIQDSMEKQMRADREKRATILQAEGARQSQILMAEGQKQAAILSAEGEKQAAILKSEGQAKAIETVFNAIHEGKPDAELLAYQYLQTLPLIAQGEANKVWIIPSDLQQAVGRVAGAVKDLAPGPSPLTDGQKPE